MATSPPAADDDPTPPNTRNISNDVAPAPGAKAKLDTRRRCARLAWNTVPEKVLLLSAAFAILELHRVPERVHQRTASAATSCGEVGVYLFNNSGKSRAAAERSRELRKAEDDAPRLAVELPALRSARIEIVEHTGNGSSKFIKHVVVARSPALFIIPCNDPVCKNGGHDITAELLRAFRRRLSEAVVESACGGTIGSAPCQRKSRASLAATYADSAHPDSSWHLRCRSQRSYQKPGAAPERACPGHTRGCSCCGTGDRSASHDGYSVLRSFRGFGD